jgi:hypothetical protein
MCFPRFICRYTTTSNDSSHRWRRERDRVEFVEVASAAVVVGSSLGKEWGWMKRRTVRKSCRQSFPILRHIRRSVRQITRSLRQLHLPRLSRPRFRLKRPVPSHCQDSRHPRHCDPYHVSNIPRCVNDRDCSFFYDWFQVGSLSLLVRSSSALLLNGSRPSGLTDWFIVWKELEAGHWLYRVFQSQLII